jgi:hypothetical protein
MAIELLADVEVMSGPQWLNMIKTLLVADDGVIDAVKSVSAYAVVEDVFVAP